MTAPGQGPLRVAFDGRALSSPAGGVRRYARDLFTAMAGLPDVDLVALGGPPARDLPSGIRARPSRFGVATNLGWTQLGLPLTALGQPIEVFHGPAYTAPLWGVPTVVLTLHDVSYARHPEWYPYRSDRLRLAFYRACARKADRLITDSEFSRREIQEAYAIDAAKISVVPLGVGSVFSPSADPAHPRRSPASPYVMHVGDLHPRRNLETALQAVLAIRARTRDLADLRLVCVGVDRGSAAGLHDRARRAGAERCVELRASISDADLVDLYRSAVALVYPSRYEGFGLPLIEAMACGTPVVASNAASIPEVVGTAGRLLDPDDVDGFADAITTLALDADVRSRWRTAAIERASTFTWMRAAEETLRVYRGARGV